MNNLLDFFKGEAPPMVTNTLENTPTDTTAPSIGIVGVQSLEKLPMVLKAVREWQTAISQIPLQVLNTQGRPATNANLLVRVLAAHNMVDLLARTVADMMTHGFGAWRMLADGNVAYLQAVNLTRQSQESRTWRYQPYRPEPMIVLDEDEILFFQDPNPVGDTAIAPIKVLRTVIEQYLWRYKTNTDSAKAYGNLNRYLVGIYPNSERSAKPITSQEAEAVQARLDGSDGKGGKAAVVRGKADVNVVGAHDDKDFVPVITLLIQETARAFDIPSLLLDDLSNSTYNNVREVTRNWYRDSVSSKLTLIEGALTSRLCVGAYMGYSIRFDRTAVEYLNPDLPALAPALAQLVGAGILTTDEARIRLGYEALE